jgi:outer membrane protein TolC
LNVYYQGKELSGVEYYQLWDNTLRIPVWFGTDFKVGYENNTGQYVNSESQTSGDGLWYAGVTVPLGQGLFIDERRKTIQQARLLPQQADADRITAINGVLIKATNDYWDWYHSWMRYNLLDSSYTLAKNRFDAIKSRAALGELPWIDTVEALIAVVDRQMLLEQSITELNNAKLQVSVHLWTVDETPVELTDGIVPFMSANYIEAISLSGIDSLVATSMETHPDLVRINVQMQMNMIERRYQRDLFKPKLALEYNFLTTTRLPFSTPVDNSYFRNNYKLGVNFSYPLFLRKERGKFQRVEIKQLQLNASLEQKQREVTTSIRVNHANWLLFKSQIGVQKQQLLLLTQLRDAEQTRFFAGESSFFLVNTREMTLITNELKLYELQVKAAKAQAMIYWSSGTLLSENK